MMCPVCRNRAVEKMPMCPSCWTTVPQTDKRRLGTLNPKSAEYQAAIDALVDEMRAKADA